MKNKIKYILCALIILFISLGVVSAADDNNTIDTYENVDDNQQIEQTSFIEKQSDNTDYKDTANDNIITKEDNDLKTSSNNKADTLTINVSVVNESVELDNDLNKEVVITKDIPTVNGLPDVTKLGIDYAYADENATYTILGSEIRRVMKLDSYCQQIYGFYPKYTFFRAAGSNVKYVISREKWNVIARSLNGYHVNQGYNAVNTPYSITVNLSNKIRYYPVYYDEQERINGDRYTCGPTSMSMISQYLNCYASERKLAGVYKTTARDGTAESNIIRYSPSVHMKLTNINNTESALKSAINSGKAIFWHIAGHYMCILSFNSQNNKFLCLNPSGPSHNIPPVEWLTWNQLLNTDRKLKDNGFMSVTPLWNLTSSEKTYARNYYYNMGGKYTIPANNEYSNNGYDNKVSVTVNQPSNIVKKANQTILKIKSEAKSSSGFVNTGKISLYLNNNPLNTINVKNSMINLDYKLPAYTSNNVTVTAKYVDSSNMELGNTSVSFNKFSAGRSFYNTTSLTFGKIIVDNITAKKGDKVIFMAHVFDANDKAINSGKVVFKINGKTIKDNNASVKANVVGGVAKLEYVIPAYSAKAYNITAVFGNNTARLEGNSRLTILKSGIKIDDLSFTEDNQTGYLVGKIVDEKGASLERDTKISIKIDGITVMDKILVKDGIINIKIDLSKYKNATHRYTICVGEGGVYKSLKVNNNFIKNTENRVNVTTMIKNLKITKNNNLYTVTAYIVNDKNVRINDNIKLSIKLNGKTIIKEAVMKEGFIKETLDLSNYKKNRYAISLICKETKTYRSCRLNDTLSTI